MSTSKGFFGRLSPPALFLTLVVAAAGDLYSQQIDYAKRELQASPAVKARLAEIRSRITKRNLKFTVGYTSVFDDPITNLTGARSPANLAAFMRDQPGLTAKMLLADKMVRLDYEKRTGRIITDAILSPSVDSPFLDWRRLGIKTRVQNQNPCGSCWDFGALAAYESNYQKRNGITPDLSEQQILDCSNAGGCPGGSHVGVLDYLILKGTILESAYSPYIAAKNPKCSYTGNGNFKAVAWGLVTTDILAGTHSYTMPSVAALKENLVKYGPITVGLWVTSDFQAYAGGVFEEAVPAGAKNPDGLTVQSDGTLMGPYQGETIYAYNHFVLLIGWDDSKGAWLIKNSWGNGWGETGGYGTERGYAWIKYNNDNIGLWASWVMAESTAIKPVIIKPELKIPIEKPKPKPIEVPKVIIKP